jgi:hypothetical protein
MTGAAKQTTVSSQAAPTTFCKICAII